MIKGWWYPSGSSARASAELSAIGDVFTVTADEGDSVSGTIDQLDISPRVGNITRRILLPDQSLFETDDNNGVDRLQRESSGGTQVSGMLHNLETSWRWIGAAFVVTLLIVFSTVYWGLPWASKEIAFSLPPAVMRLISTETMDILDKGFLEPSELPQKKQESIRERFEKKLLVMQNSGFSYQLHFRKLKKIPNAFALPSGDIIVTDRLVELAESQDEIDAILFHEIGHVVHRHALQSVLHSSFLTVVIIMVTGDVTAIQNMAVAVPIFLLQSHYSREHEAEADQFAFSSMVQAGIDPINFARIMRRITLAHDAEDKEKKVSGKVAAKDQAPKEKEAAITQYKSTHPATAERIQQAEEYSERFKQKRKGQSGKK